MFFFFNDTATTEIYTLSLHDALPIWSAASCWGYNGDGELGDGTTTDRSSPVQVAGGVSFAAVSAASAHTDRKSTRLNSSHLVISYAVFCLKKKKKQTTTVPRYIVKLY